MTLCTKCLRLFSWNINEYNIVRINQINTQVFTVSGFNIIYTSANLSNIEFEYHETSTDISVLNVEVFTLRRGIFMIVNNKDKAVKTPFNLLTIYQLFNKKKKITD